MYNSSKKRVYLTALVILKQSEDFFHMINIFDL